MSSNYFSFETFKEDFPEKAHVRMGLGPAGDVQVEKERRVRDIFRS